MTYIKGGHYNSVAISASLRGVSQSAVTKWCQNKANLLPSVVIGGRRIINEDDLVRYDPAPRGRRW